MISLLFSLALAAEPSAFPPPAAAPVTLTLHAPAPPAMRSGVLEYPISIGDLDLGTPAGRAEALARAERGSARLCDWMAPGAEQRACARATIDRAVRAPAGLVLAQALRERPLPPAAGSATADRTAAAAGVMPGAAVARSDRRASAR